MRKLIAVLISICLIVLGLAGCSSRPAPFTAEDFVTMEQLNTEGKYVARGFFESIYTYDENMFIHCFPDGYVEELGKAAGGDIFEQYKNTMNLGGTFMGSASAGYKECTVENGFDVATMRARICFATGFQYSDVGQIQIQKISVQFMNEKDARLNDFYFIVYEKGGSWYMFELFTENAGF